VSDDGLRRTPLEREHVALGAKIGAFAGWMMPIEYQGVLAEHRAVRERVGLFDLSHLGKVEVVGPGALGTLQGLLSNDLAKVDVGRAQYNLVLNDGGGIEDDLIVYRLGSERWFVVPNASNTSKVVAMLRRAAREAEILEHEWCFLGLQGPRSLEVVGALFPDAFGLPFMGCTVTEYHGLPLVLTRSGYTGELGFEMFTDAAAATDLWGDLMGRGAVWGIEPCGLGARDVLRLEMGYPLYGQDLSPERTPLEAGLSWAVALDKADLVGGEALRRQSARGPRSRLRGLVTEERRHIPRPHHRVLADGRVAGEVTSGTFSPTLGRGIALAYLSPAEAFEPGREVEIDIRGRRGPARVVTPPFVDRSPRG
jgi:aminomethyltransferase